MVPFLFDPLGTPFEGSVIEANKKVDRTLFSKNIVSGESSLIYIVADSGWNQSVLHTALLLGWLGGREGGREGGTPLSQHQSSALPLV